ELDDLESIEHSERMVRRSRNRNSNCGNARETEYFEGHERLSRCFLVFSGYQSLTKTNHTRKRLIAGGNLQLRNRLMARSGIPPGERSMRRNIAFLLLAES